ncbi:Os03g0779600 [Oryza sativa Japonica Group]|uniref:Os03g0779600 protein n=1 Tax=Oryza sativa subsp. japonica TaxID=39947 RepID=A0A0P0W495_ORYSJ|nr:Os03g0779600 [Oryza sativa Japonica Group]
MDKTNSVPCLALYVKHGADSDKPALFSISEKKAINNNIPGLTNTNSWVTPQGWILVRDTVSTATFLQNPHDSTDKIQLPHLSQNVHSSSTCLLSCKPTMPGCVVLLVEPVGTIIWYCHIGDDDKWDHEKVPICSIAAFQGKFYFNGDFESIGVLEFSPEPTFSSITITDPIIGGLGVVGMANVYLVESLDELYMVCQMYDSEMETIYDVTVYRMDFSKQQWCVAEDIGGRAFLTASCYFGASRSADEYGLEKDCVYAIFARDKYYEVSKVEDGETEEHELIEAPDSKGGTWILPVE